MLCKRRNILIFVVLQNSKHILFGIPHFRIVSKSNFAKHKTYDETNKTNKNDQKWVKKPCFWVKNRDFRIFRMYGIFGTHFILYV